MKYFILTLLLLCAVAAYADKTTRRGLKVAPAKETVVSSDTLDSFVPSPGMIRLSGYDKPLRSTKESIFVTNASRRTLCFIDLEITYFDESGRQMHKRNIKLHVNIPGGETRQLTFSSWDKQRNLYYVKSGKPRTSDGTPYSISAKVIEAAYPRH